MKEICLLGQLSKREYYTTYTETYKKIAQVGGIKEENQGERVASAGKDKETIRG